MDKPTFQPAIILNMRYTGSNMALVTLLSKNNGLKKGIVKIAKKRQAELQKGNIIEFIHLKRNDDALGTIKFNLLEQTFIKYFDNRQAIKNLNYICKNLTAYLKQNIAYPQIFQLTNTVLENLDSGDDLLLPLFKFHLLKHLGYTIDINDFLKIDDNDASPAYYISPKSARVISQKLGTPYHDKLLILPQILGGKETNEQKKLIERINQLLIKKMHD